jgi:hypothetical protein
VSDVITNSEAASTRNDSADAVSDPVRIVHLTDLHYGWRFNDVLWRNASNIIKSLNPHVIIVTGDLVNSPFRWRFRSVLGKLEALRDSCPPTCLLYVIPGNHDTRVFGIFPVAWLLPLAVAVFAVAIIIILANWIPFIYATILVILLIIITVFCYFLAKVNNYFKTYIQPLARSLAQLKLFLYPFEKFNDYFEKYIPPLPCSLAQLKLFLYPFDSSTSATSAACGAIKPAQFEAAQSSDTAADGMYKIALLHHHSLPIPYDSAQESMMVLKNAGAFLSEAAKLGVRLVLSGHKHHQHFSRVTINAETPDESQLCVLNTGSPTAGRKPGTFGHNFSVIEIHRHGGAKIIPYHAAGGTFNPKSGYWAENVEASGKALFRENSGLLECQCERVSLGVEIGPDGDGHYVYAVRGFRYLGASQISSIPGELCVTVGIGQIERLKMTTESSGSPIRDLEWIERNRREQRGRINLAGPITADSEPFNFTIQCDLTNCFAMSAQQFHNMYPAHTGEAVEFASLHLELLNIPTADATMLVKLPEGFIIQGDPWLSITRADGSREHRLEDSYRSHLVFLKQSNVVFVRLPFAPLGPRYRLMWKLTNQPPPAGAIALSLVGAARGAEAKLQKLAQTGTQNENMSRLLGVIEELAQSHFNLATEPLSLDIMVFDHTDKKLRVAAASYPSTDPRWKHAIDYGDGIAGRAYKMNRVSLFVKARARVHQTPFFYALATGQPISESGDEIPDEALLSLPLSYPMDSYAIFGILNISSRQASSSLVNITEDSVTTEFRRAVSIACFQAISELSI